MTRPIAKFFIGFVIGVGFLVVAAMVLALARPMPAPPRLPNPNGYDDFIKAGSLVSGNVGDYPHLNTAALRQLLTTNVEPLSLVRTGLTRACRVPLDYSPANVATRITHLGGIKSLAQLLAAEGRLAELENRPGDAAECYLTAIRLGRAVGEGGLMIDTLVGVAIQAIGLAGAERLVQSLDAKHCREFASTLETIEAQRDSPQMIEERDRTWSRRVYGLRADLYHVWYFKSNRQSRQRFTSRYVAIQARVRRLSIALAARAYELEQGQRPTNLSQLAPAYLKAVPLDPLTGSNMNYHP
jgi:hypothetical protein